MRSPRTFRRSLSGISNDSSKDEDRLFHMSEIISTMPTGKIVQELIGDRLHPDVAQRILNDCEFRHGALLVFPTSVDAALVELEELGYSVGPVVPSTVVRQRICSRYHLPEDSVDLRITHGAISGPEGVSREIELFMFLGAAAAAVKAEERGTEHEAHFALRLAHPEQSLRSTMNELCGTFHFHRDGGGFNPYDEADHGGVSLVYLQCDEESLRQDPLFRRVELQCCGNYSSLFSQPA